VPERVPRGYVRGEGEMKPYMMVRGTRPRRISGNYISRWRTELGLSYEEVAEVLGVYPTTVRNWEKSHTVKPLIKLAFDRAFRDRGRHRVVAMAGDEQ
jgi:DNA-binding XRE family transcriptional regulator